MISMPDMHILKDDEVQDTIYLVVEDMKQLASVGVPQSEFMRIAREEVHRLISSSKPNAPERYILADTILTFREILARWAQENGSDNEQRKKASSEKGKKHEDS